MIWTGSDDGLVHVTRDGGKNWDNVTPQGHAGVDPHQLDRRFAARRRHRLRRRHDYQSDDFRPYLYKTTDYGKTWKKIVNGIPDNAFTRVVREDPNHKGLLVAGTETGLYLSLRRWRELEAVPT